MVRKERQKCGVDWSLERDLRHEYCEKRSWPDLGLSDLPKLE